MKHFTIILFWIGYPVRLILFCAGFIILGLIGMLDEASIAEVKSILGPRRS